MSLSLAPIIPTEIYIMNATRMYLGNALNVPDEAGINTAKKEKRIYEKRTLFFRA